MPVAWDEVGLKWGWLRLVVSCRLGEVRARLGWGCVDGEVVS